MSTPILDARCPCCGGRDLRPVSSTLLACRGCGHADASSVVASGEVVNEAPDAAASIRPGRLHREQLRVAAAARPGPGQVIDVGCANGGFLRHAAAAGLADATSYGIEISEPNAAAARRAGVVVVDHLGDVAPGALVTMWHSAEHLAVAELGALLATVAQRSAGQARVVVAVPNGGSIQRRVFGSRWAYRDDETHRSEFTLRSLGLVVSRAGWEIERLERTPVYGMFGAAQSSLNLLRPRNELYEAAKRGSRSAGPATLAANALSALVVAPVAAAVALAEIAPRRAAVLTVVARPSGPPSPVAR